MRIQMKCQPHRATGKLFENDVKVALTCAQLDGIIQNFERIPDGNKVIRTSGGTIAVPCERTSGDFHGTVIGNIRFIIEAKHTDSKSLRVELEEPKNKKQKCNGLHYHQMMALIEESQNGGMGILVVQFWKHGVYALDGLALYEWLTGGDESRLNRKSISLAHFQEWGSCLGELGNWQFSESDFRALAATNSESKSR